MAISRGRTAPSRDAKPHPETSALFLYLNTSKRSVTLDLASAAGRDALLRLAAGADVLLENYRPGDARRLGLGYEALRAVNPQLVLVSITAYGQDGPYAEDRSNNLIAFAMGGQMFLTGTADRGPVKNGGYQADYQGGLNAFSAANLALLAAERDGEGEHVDISVQHCMAPILEAGIPFYSYNGVWAGVRRGNLMSSFMGVYPCLDGQVGVHVMARNWPPFAQATGHPEWLEDERFATAEARRAHDDELMAEVIAWAASVRKKDAYASGGSTAHRSRSFTRWKTSWRAHSSPLAGSSAASTTPLPVRRATRAHRGGWARMLGGTARHRSWASTPARC